MSVLFVSLFFLLAVGFVGFLVFAFVLGFGVLGAIAVGNSLKRMLGVENSTSSAPRTCGVKAATSRQTSRPTQFEFVDARVVALGVILVPVIFYARSTGSVSAGDRDTHAESHASLSVSTLSVSASDELPAGTESPEEFSGNELTDLVQVEDMRDATNYTVIRSGQFADPEEANAEALKELESILWKLAQEEFGPVAYPAEIQWGSITEDLVVSRELTHEDRQLTPSFATTMYTSELNIDYKDDHRKQLFPAWRMQVVKERLQLLGVMLTCVATLGICLLTLTSIPNRLSWSWLGMSVFVWGGSALLDGWLVVQSTPLWSAHLLS